MSCRDLKRFFFSVAAADCRRLLCLVLLTSVLVTGCDRPDPTSPTVSEQQLPPRPGPVARVPAQEPVVASDVRFEMIAAESGFEFQRFDDMQGQRRILEVNGGGVALFDFDRDGWPDVFMSNGCRLPLSETDRQTPGQLFRNRRNLHFQPCRDPSGLLQFGFGTGCGVADVNQDGFEDLYVAAFGRNQLWMNLGDGTFQPAPPGADPAPAEWSSSVAFTDLNGDAAPDLYVVNYLLESDTDPILCPNPYSPDGYEGCPPSIFDGVPDRLLLNDGQGGFRDVSAKVGLDQLPGKGLGVVICNLGQDFRPEIYVANDGQPNYLFTVHHDPVTDDIRLQDTAVAANAALSESGYAQASMGIAAADYDHNQAIDLFLTHFYSDTNTLYLNRSVSESAGGMFFEEATRSSRLGAASRLTLGFGTVPIDLENDGWQDLFVANGHIDDRTWAENPQPWRMPPQLFRNRGDARFDEISGSSGSYFRQDWLGRGAAMGDLDRDGRMDLAVSHQVDPSTILRNDTPTSHHQLTLQLIGTRSSRTAVGTEVTVTTGPVSTMQQLAGGGSFQSASVNELTFGLGAHQSADVRIRWPDGQIQNLALAAGRWAIVEAPWPYRYSEAAG